MSQSLSLSSTVGVLPCPSCGKTINTSMRQCPFCSVAVDGSAAEAAAERFGIVNQAISDASYLKIMAGCALFFFVLRFAPLLGMPGVVGFWFLEFAIPFMSIRWWIKFRKVKSADKEFLSARRTVLFVGAGCMAFFVLSSIG